MTAEGHLIFSIACAVFSKKAEITSVLAQGDLWHIIPSAILSCLLPDIDHPRSMLGQRLTWISKPVAKACGHRGFTHSLLALLSALTIFYLYILYLDVPESFFIPIDALHGMVLGYLSHILADMLTPAGVPLLWPCSWRFRLPILAQKKGKKFELVLCIAFLVYAVWMQQFFSEKGLVLLSSNIMTLLKMQLNSFL